MSEMSDDRGLLTSSQPCHRFVKHAPQKGRARAAGWFTIDGLRALLPAP
jgi:hypothetical protein